MELSVYLQIKNGFASGKSVSNFDDTKWLVSLVSTSCNYVGSWAWLHITEQNRTYHIFININPGHSQVGGKRKSI